MTHFTRLLYIEWINALGWTLLHSIWQSMLIVLVVAICLRLIPAGRSQLRYAVACGGLLLIAISSLVTFVYLENPVPLSLQSPAIATSQNVVQVAFNPSSTAPIGIFSAIASTMGPFMPAIVGIWAVGFLFFSVRLFNALLYTSRIRSSSVPLTNEWTTFLQNSAAQLGIRRQIGLAESSSIVAPVVIGYLKPVILIPLGMISGLTTEQLETIFLHELAHIRRHDYLINLIQSALEAIFFFSPFVWILSGMIRKERECCCDDLVIRQHGGDRVYAHALVRLAEARLSPAGFALSLAADNNQLLYRIKRIMERPGKTNPKSRFVLPAILLLGALLCISWLGTGETPVATPLQKQDTIPSGKKNSASYSRKSIITLDEHGQPHEEVIENFEGDESLRPLLQGGFPALPPFAGIPDDPMKPNPMWPDTIPPFGLQGMDRWDDFARAFEENFRERFDSFDGFPFADSAGFMQRFHGNFTWPDLDSLQIPDNAMRALDDFDLGDLQENLEQLRDLHMDRFRGMEKQFQDFGQRTSRYQDVLREELVKDGYLAEGEAIESLEWNNDKFKVNGKSIRKADLNKYNKLNEQYLGASSKPGKLE